MFKEQIGRYIEVYVDDLLVKSKEPEQHANNLREAFTVFQKYKMNFNVAKYAFEVESGKSLCFMVSERSIEANLRRSKPLST